MIKQCKKVIAINSSRRNKNTYKILKNIQDELQKRYVKVEIINLFDYDIKPCIGCEQCLKGFNCSLKDDTEMLMRKLNDYDGIILSSPVYMGNVSGKLKEFIDIELVDGFIDLN